MISRTSLASTTEQTIVAPPSERAAASKIDDRDREIIERIAPLLKDEGLFFVGIDVIGGRLTEINVTSPTGVQEINALAGVHLEGQVIDRVEALLDDGVRQI